MAGWNLKTGIIKDNHPSYDRIWSLFNYVFSSSCKKRNTYKFGLIKALLDSTFDGECQSWGVYYSYEHLFAKFTENYWNLVVKYDLRQMRKDGRSTYSKIESIIKEYVKSNSIYAGIYQSKTRNVRSGGCMYVKR